jgi:hypothetical protein
MSEGQRFFLSLVSQRPARLTVEQVGWLLSCAPTHIRILVQAGLLKPLGNPPLNSEKLFGPEEILGLTKDAKWFAKVTNTIHKAHTQKNLTERTAKRNGIAPWRLSQAA